jgi:hypothetical protein
MVQLEGMSLAYTDDMSDKFLDISRLKSVVGHENSDGRTLYERSTHIINLKCKVLWTSNVTPNLAGDDKALWDRYVQLPFDASYVEKDPDPSRFRFKQDLTKYDRLLSLTNAFFTVTTAALSRYYQEDMKSNDIAPPSLGPMTVPRIISEILEQERMQKSPITRFFFEHVRRTPDHYVEAQEMFNEYLGFLEATNDQVTKRKTTLPTFKSNIASSLDIRIEGERICGCELFNRNVRARGEGGGPYNVVTFHNS